jgi:FemAB-related protein (PEP-CTERM system-associated)
MQIVCATREDSARWDEFVARHPECINYHRWKWQEVIQRSFNWTPHYLFAEHESCIVGIVPTLYKKTLFGGLLVSVPFFSAAGIAADSPEAERLLVAEVLACAQRIGAKRVELRHRRQHDLGLPVNKQKVTLVVPLDADPEQMMRRFDTKMRTSVRRSLKSGFTGEMGGREFVKEFYSLFAQKMRDFGTPVYSIRFFEEIFDSFPDETCICRVRYEGQTIAAAFLTGYRGAVEANWSSSLAQYASLKPNVFMYWTAMCALAQRGYRSFDFGRSTFGSGTYAFKRQWNPEDVPLFWDYWRPDLKENRAAAEREQPLLKTAMWVWRRLPVSVTKIIGPPIARDLP